MCDNLCVLSSTFSLASDHPFITGSSHPTKRPPPPRDKTMSGFKPPLLAIPLSVSSAMSDHPAGCREHLHPEARPAPTRPGPVPPSLDLFCLVPPGPAPLPSRPVPSRLDQLRAATDLSGDSLSGRPVPRPVRPPWPPRLTSCVRRMIGGDNFPEPRPSG